MTKHTESIEVVVKDLRRRRWPFTEKAALVRRTYEPGMSVSLVARREGVSLDCCASGASSNARVL
ncbi:hypothetical protein HMPREF9701_05454 [Delftia acidovorans CCUG 274B]|nr:hypothetical protein HMPREF9701_05454 [Delftia acidovorans CCUG 274B]